MTDFALLARGGAVDKVADKKRNLEEDNQDATTVDNQDISQEIVPSQRLRQGPAAGVESKDT